MAKELDLSGVDDILAQDKKEEQELDLSGVDDIMATQEAPSFLREAGETAQDFSIGAGSSMLMGAADEIGGGIGAGLETILGYVPGTSAYESKQFDEQFTKPDEFGVTGQVPEDSFGDKYRTYQQGSEQAFDASAERSPYANILGQFAGGMTGGHIASSALGIGKAAAGTKTLAEIAKDSSMLKALGIGAGRGATEFVKTAPYMVPELVASSKNQLIGENANPMGVAQDVGTGLAFGLPLMMGMSATSAAGSKVAGKGAEVVEKAKAAFAGEDNPRLQLMAYNFRTGLEGKPSPRSHGAMLSQASDSLAVQDQNAVLNIVNKFDDAGETLGKNVQKSLEDATAVRGDYIPISQEIDAAAKKIQDLTFKFPEISESFKNNKAYNKIISTKKRLSPIELKSLIDDVDYNYSSFSNATLLRPGENKIADQLLQLRRDLVRILKKEVPEYRLHAERFENFRNIQEQIISRDIPTDVNNVFYGRLNDPEKKVYSSLQDMVKNVQKDDLTGESAKTSLHNFINSYEDFQKKEMSRMLESPNITPVLPKTSDMRSHILKSSTASVARTSSKSTTQGRALVPSVKESIIGKVTTSGPYSAGKLIKIASGSTKIQTAAELSRAVMKAPDNYLLNLASRLDSIGMKSTGQALKESIETGNTYKKQAALFTILQNPSAKLYINTEDFQDEKEE